MTEPIFTSEIYDSVTKLIHNIPIIDGVLQWGTIDTQFSLFIDHLKIANLVGHQKDTISFRDIIKLLSKVIEDDEWSGMILYRWFKIASGSRLLYPVEYLLLDYCLAALANDLTDAHLYLDHSRRILGLNDNFYMILDAILVNSFINDKDIRNFLALLAYIIEPISAKCHVNRYGIEYKKRYEIYQTELESIKHKTST